MATGMLISLDEYLSTTYDPDCEFVDGELIERDIGGLRSALDKIVYALANKQPRLYGIGIYTERRIRVSAARFGVPDVIVTKQKVSGSLLREPPFLCVEILSPDDRASVMQAKIDDYLDFGVNHIWLIDPRRKRGWSYKGDGTRESSDVLLTASEPRLTLILDQDLEP